VPLIRDRYFGESFDGRFEFSMRNGDAIIEFTVDPKALDHMDAFPDTTWDQRDAQFLRLRDRIETVAVCRFQDGPMTDRGTVALSVADFQRWDV
jgi:hypothetical protein